MDRTSFAVRGLFDELERQAGETWPSARAPIAWRCNRDIAPLCSDRGKAKVILHNLVGNAVKFTEPGMITVSARAVPANVEIRVADTGIGLPPECLDTIWEPFRQVDASESRSYKGTGLGLHTVKSLAELLGGTVAVQSEPERGSSFIVRRPSPDAEVERAATDAAAAAV